NGFIRGRQYIDYLVTVRRGEQLSVSMTSNNRSAYFNLIAPGQGNVAYYVGSNSNPPNRFDGMAPARGTQRIRVYLYRASGRRGEAASFQLYISTGGPGWGVNPGYPNPGYPQPGYPQPGYPQPPYPGQGFRPSGSIQCIIPGAFNGQCGASVQHLGPGAAYVRVRLPNGIVRTITYQNGYAASIDSGPPGGSFVAQKRAGDTIVQVGNETYVIPDALLFAR
ncbi:MAG TPA: hypothetical protein VFZ35_07770, partial [Sphingomicrobium sp.]